MNNPVGNHVQAGKHFVMQPHSPGVCRNFAVEVSRRSLLQNTTNLVRNPVEFGIWVFRGATKLLELTINFRIHYPGESTGQT